MIIIEIKKRNKYLLIHLILTYQLNHIYYNILIQEGTKRQTVDKQPKSEHIYSQQHISMIETNKKEPPKLFECTLCKRPIKKDLEPNFIHQFAGCYRKMCIWCWYQNYKTQCQKYWKRYSDGSHVQEFTAYMPCCKISFYGILSSMRYELISNCCIHGLSCGELFNGDEFKHQYRSSLTVGKKCYKQLSDRIKYDQHSATKNEKDVLKSLDKLSTKSCSKCHLNTINFVIGQEHQTKSGLCFDCSNIDLTSQQQKAKNLSIIKDQQNKNQPSRQHKNNQKYDLSLQQIPKPSQNRCCKCNQSLILTKNRHLSLRQFDQQIYCYFCIFEGFEAIEHKKQSYLITRAQYLKELIKFQQIFSEHCMVCGVDLDSYQQTDDVFMIQSKSMELDACYCSSCNKLLQSDINAFKNLSKLEKSISLKQIITTKISVQMYQKTIKCKLDQLFNRQNPSILSKSKQTPTHQTKKHENLVKKQKDLVHNSKFNFQKKNVQDDKDKGKGIDDKIAEPIMRQLLKEACTSNNERLTPQKSGIFISDDENGQQSVPHDQNIKNRNSEVQQQFYDCQQLKDQSSHREQSVLKKQVVSSLQSQHDKNAKTPFKQRQIIDQSLLVGVNYGKTVNALLQSKNVSIQPNHQEKVQDPQFLSKPQGQYPIPQPITINLQDTIIIDYTLEEYQNHPKSALSLTHHCAFLTQHKERHSISIQMMSQLDELLKSGKYLNYLKQGYLDQDDYQKTKSNRLSNDSFAVKQCQCWNCGGLDFLLSLGCLCQLCFTKYLMGQQVRIKCQDDHKQPSPANQSTQQPKVTNKPTPIIRSSSRVKNRASSQLRK